MCRALVTVSMLLALPLTALAQPRPRESAVESVTHYGQGAFEVETLEGTRRSPDGDRVQARRRRGYGTLLRIRTDFWPELTKSVENQ